LFCEVSRRPRRFNCRLLPLTPTRGLLGSVFSPPFSILYGANSLSAKDPPLRITSRFSLRGKFASPLPSCPQGLQSWRTSLPPCFIGIFSVVNNNIPRCRAGGRYFFFVKTGPPFSLIRGCRAFYSNLVLGAQLAVAAGLFRADQDFFAIDNGECLCISALPPAQRLALPGSARFSTFFFSRSRFEEPYVSWTSLDGRAVSLWRFFASSKDWGARMVLYRSLLGRATSSPHFLWFYTQCQFCLQSFHGTSLPRSDFLLFPTLFVWLLPPV